MNDQLPERQDASVSKAQEKALASRDRMLAGIKAYADKLPDESLLQRRLLADAKFMTAKTPKESHEAACEIMSLDTQRRITDELAHQTLSNAQKMVSDVLRLLG